MTDPEAIARAARRVAAATTLSPVPSPCVAVCRMDETSGYCEGCLRTIDEIIGWGAAPESARRAVWTLIGQRAAAAQRATGKGGGGPA